MIQRIQTVYLSFAVILFSIVNFGSPVFYFLGNKMYEFTLYGIFEKSSEKSSEKTSESIAIFPLYMVTVFIAVLLIVAIFSYKNLKKQFLLVRIATLVNGLFILGLVAYYFLHSNPIKAEDTTIQIGNGCYLLLMTLPLLFLANNGIKRDKKLIDSLNRLR